MGCSCSSASFRRANAGLYLWLRSVPPLRGNHGSASSRPIKQTLVPSLGVYGRVRACFHQSRLEPQSQAADEQMKRQLHQTRKATPPI